MSALEYWRGLFRSSGADVLEVIERAIDVAASDRPGDLRARRDRIAERLFPLSKCAADRLRSASAVDVEKEEEEKGDVSVRGSEVEKESKVCSSIEEPESELVPVVSNYSYDVAEALTHEMEEENLVVREVTKIKDILYNQKEESECVLHNSLKRLQLMLLSVETLKATEIGKAVNSLRKHNSRQIRNLVRILIDGWKVMVDEWVNTTNAISEKSPDSVNPISALDDEEGLPSPPLDEGAFLAAHTTGIQLSGFFDGMDDDGNFSEMDKKVVNARPNVSRRPERKQQSFSHPTAEIQNTRNTRPVEALNGHMSCGSGSERPSRTVSEQKPCNATESNQPKVLVTSQRNPMAPVLDKPKDLDDASVRAKLEVAKRKLHERYQEAENAKKQRTIQVMELQDIPKQSSNLRQTLLKPKNGIKNWGGNARR